MSKGLEKNSSSDKQKRLDLGFESLVSSLAEDSDTAAEIVKSSQSTKQLDLNGKSSRSSASGVDDLQSLFDRKEWKTLQKLSEKELDRSEEESPLTRLFWVKSQLELKTVPASILSAPADSATKSLLKQIDQLDLKLKKEIALILIKIGSNLTSTLSDNLGFEFYNRSLKFDLGVADKLRDVLVNEQELVDQTLGKKKLKERRQQAIDKLTLKLGKKEKVATNSEEPKIKVASDKPKSKQLSYKLIAVISLFAMLYGGYQYKDQVLALFSDDAEKPYLPIETGEQRAEPVIPKAERVAKLTTLDAILYDMKEAKAGLTKEEIDSSLPEKTEVSSPTKNATAPQHSVKKETVNTTSPVEGTVFYPELSKLQNQNLADESSYPGSSPSLPSEDLSGKGELYRIIASTRVMSKPSFLGISIAYLDQGARIEVLSRSGDWLKVRSRKGKLGFVLAQDAERLY
ncbi:MAG: hypothetical protein H6619_05445 [Deltaproteobacteria bacterium]|nr:hypothetical protein [Deltaproteobacteria bacterium]